MDAREAALFALMRFRRDRAWADAALDSVILREKLESRDAALAGALCLGVLRNAALLDFYIDGFSTVKAKKLEPKVRDILRISIFQLAFMDRIPPSAAVSEGVRLCKKENPRASGLVNAVLRRAAERSENMPEPPGEGSSEYLTVKYSHPAWIVNELIALLGYEGARAVLEKNNAPAPPALQVNTQRTSPERLLDSLRAWGLPVEPHGLLPDCLALGFAGDVARLEEFERGEFYIQDPASRISVIAAAPQPGDRVLDLCAAPGGKSFAAAIAMKNEGEIIACDIHGARLKRVDEGARRLGLDIIKTRVTDALNPASEFLSGFDLVIADAPCSGLGVIRRKPEIRYKPREELSGLPEIQLGILRSAALCVRPGGALLYSVCTWRECETSDVVSAFFEKNGDFEPEEFEGSDGGMRVLWPHESDTDGFFICKLRKRT